MLIHRQGIPQYIAILLVEVALNPPMTTGTEASAKVIKDKNEGIMLNDDDKLNQVKDSQETCKGGLVAQPAVNEDIG
jgi:hypothetical protein